MKRNKTMGEKNSVRTEDLLDRIAVDPKVMLGKPVVRGTRITVELILERLAGGATFDELLDAYPHLKREDILSALSFASHALSNDEIILEKAAR